MTDPGCDITSIYADYGPRLKSYIRQRVANSADADDILQEVFYQLVRTASDDSSPRIEKISAWLYRVAHNSILNFRRRKCELSLQSSASDFKEAADEAVDTLAEMIFGAGECSDGPEAVYLRKLVWQELEYALADLPPEQSEVFCLTVFDAVPVKVISENTGVPVATLLSRKHYAVKFLRLRLRGLYDDILTMD